MDFGESFFRGRRSLLALVAAAALGAAGCTEALDPADAVSLDVARADLEAGRAILIDIREKDEHATGVANGAVLLLYNSQNRSGGGVGPSRDPEGRI